MYRRDPANLPNESPWLVRAEVTIRHNSPGSSGSTGPAGATGMVYRWNPHQPTTQSSMNSLINSSTQSSVSSPPSFGFQRGNIFFTSTPPPRTSLPRTVSRNDGSISPMGRGVSVSDSGYTSEQLSQQSYSSLPSRRLSQVYNRRCKSTCSITLSTGVDKDEKSGFISGKDNNVNVNNSRSQVSQAPQTMGRFYNDPWSCRSAHQHQHQHQHAATRCRFSTVPEVCEDCAEGSSTSSSAFTTHFCTRVPDKTVNKTTTVRRDAASQTTDIETQHSPILGIKTRTRRKTLGARGLDEQRKRKNINSPPTPSSIKSSSSPIDQEKSDTSSKEDSEKRKSRTVHIDVYCTGTDDDLNDSSTDSSSSKDDFEKPSLVIANQDLTVIHTEMSNNSILPRGFQDDKAFLKRADERRCESFRHAPMRMPSLASSKGYESDDVLSSLYPSQFSSYSALRDLDSIAWSSASSSSAMVLDACDSSSVTSWKDTVSDVESLVNSRNNLTPCDSFEYADSSDLVRIRNLESARSSRKAQDKSKTWKSPETERRHLLQNKKMNEYMEKHRVGWSSEESLAESNGSDEVAWSFLSSDDHPSTIKGRMEQETPAVANVVLHANPEIRRQSPILAKVESRITSPAASRVTSPPTSRVTSPFTSRVTSPLTSRVTSPFTSRVTSPFTTPQGEKTDHIVKASIFGRVIAAFKKPGHHIGPAKNPSCSCDHCRRYFEERSRDRSRSLCDFERRSSSQLSRAERNSRSACASSRD
ncbi:uncharacterized protein LOC117176750 isoform X2 [Belonocnema kinseyi]|uniref:uncharacterized protein LOC117176750 isoform X2 n=1 Tax=Belonocnema kinseyi TaxID=2817044 RepID=UPI00143CF27C|nr:uncharacterized protein LOC117176750 isoform X2 [Belonocnema kinseyi]